MYSSTHSVLKEPLLAIVSILNVFIGLNDVSGHKSYDNIFFSRVITKKFDFKRFLYFFVASPFSRNLIKVIDLKRLEKS